jgi:cell division protein FtsQ
LSGIDIGQRILPINLNELRKRIKRHPSVIEVKIKRKLPDQIIIHLQTRNPIAIALLEKMYYVDDGGVAYKQVGVLDNYDYPVITGVYTNELEVTERRLKDAVRILSALNAREFSTINRGLSELHYVNEGFVYIYLKGLRAGIKLYVPELEQEVPKVEKALRYLSENGLLDRTRQIAPYHRDGVAVALRERA